MKFTTQLNHQVRLSSGSTSLPTIVRFAVAGLLWIATLSAAQAQTIGIQGAPCVGQTVIYYLTGSCSDFTWSVSGGTMNPADQGTGSMRVTYSTATTSNIQVSATCGGSYDTYQLNGVTIAAYVTPAVSLAVSPTPVCKGSLLALTAAPTNGGTPTYNYYVDGVSVYSGSANSYNYNTTSMTAGAHSAYVIMTSSLTCVTSTSATSSTQNFTVTGKTTYTANISSLGLICQGATSATLVANVGGSVGGLTYEWFRQGVSQGAATSSNSYLFNSPTNGEVMYCKVYSSDWCVDSPVQTANYTISITSTVTPTLSVQVSTNSICSGGTLTFTAQGSHLSGATYQWLLNGNVLSGQTGSSTQLVTSSTNESGKYYPGSVVTLNASGFTGNCLSATSGTANTSGAPTTILPLPNALATPSTQSVCSGQPMASVAITNPNSVPGTTYTWTVSAPSITGASSGSGSTIAQTLSQTTNTNKTATYTITPSANSCPGTTFQHVVTVKPLPDAQVSSASQSTCSAQAMASVSLTNPNAVSGTTFSWTVSAPSITGGSASSGSSIAQTLSQTTNVNQTATYTVTPTASSCNGPTVQHVVTVKPLPTAQVSTSSQSVCSAQAMTSVALTNPNTVSGTTFSWTVSAPNTTGSSGGSGTSIAQTLTQTTNVNQSGTYTVTPAANGCNGATVQHLVTVKPIPNAQVSSASQSTCSAQVMASVALTNPNGVSGTTFSWTVSAPSITGGSASSGSAIAQTLSQTTNVNQTATYTVTPSAASCAGPTVQHVVTVKPVPTIQLSTVSQSLCSAVAMTAVTITNPNSVSGTTLAWTVSAPSITGSAGGTGSSIAQTLSQTTNVNQTATYTATATANGCVGSTPHVVTVKPIPNAQVSSASQSTCSAQAMASVSLTNPNGVSGTTFSWTVSAPSITGSSASSGSSIAQTLSQTTSVNQTATYTVTPTATSCNGSTVQHVVTVKPIPTVQVSSASQSLCSAVAMIAVTITNPNSVSGTTLAWTVSAPVEITGEANGSGSSILQTLAQVTNVSQTAAYTATATANSCISSVQHVVTVKPIPTAQVSTASQSLCSAQAMTSVALTNPNNVSGTTLAWTVSAPSITGSSGGTGTTIAQTLTQTTSINQTATYAVTPTAASCNGTTVQHVVTVKPIPNAQVSSASQSTCSAQVMTSVSLTNPNAVSGTTFAWTLSAPNITGGSANSGSSIAQTLSQATNVNQTATYTVTPTAASCNGSTVQHVVTVKPLPTVQVSSASQSLCSAVAMTSVTITNPNAVSGTTLAWTVSAPVEITGEANGSGSSIAQTLSQLSNTDKIATYTATATANSCSSSVDHVVTVKPIPTAQVSSTSQSICSAVSMTSVSLTNPNNVSGTTLAWTVSAPSITGSSGGTSSSIAQTLSQTTSTNQTATYTVTPTASSCNGSTVQHIVTVKPLPTVQVSSSSQSLCSGLAMTSVTITNPNSVSGTALAWTVSAPVDITGEANGSGSSILQTLVQGTNVNQTATYTATATAANCTSSINHVVTVKPIPTVQVSSSSQSLCSGVAMSSITITNPNSVSGAALAWTVSAPVEITGETNGSGSSIAQTLSQATNTDKIATYTATATANSCSSSIQHAVTVKPIPTVQVSSGSQSLCSGAAMTSVTITNPNTVSGATLAWTVSAPVEITGEASGSGSSIAQTLSQTTNTDKIATYAATATANSCSSTVDHVVTVKPVPTINVSSASQSLCSGIAMTTVTITNPNSVSGTALAWMVSAPVEITGESSGSGGSIAQTLSQASNADKIATYTATATANGCATSGDHVVTVKPIPTINVSSASQSLCSGIAMTAVTITNPNTVSGTALAWTVSAPVQVTGESNGSGSSIQQTLAQTTNVDQLATYTATATANSCSSSIQHVVTVKPIPTINVSSASQSLCSGIAMTAVTITNPNSVSGTALAWTVSAPVEITGESNGSGGSIAQTLAQASSTDKIATYTATATANSCVTSAQHVVTVKPIPTVQVSTATQNLCSGQTMATVTITNPNTVSGTTFAWTVSAASITGASAGSGTSIGQTLSQVTTSNKTAVYTITPTAASCAGTAVTSSVVVYAPIVAGSAGTATAVCTGSDPAVLTNTASPTGGSGSYSYQWQQSPNGTSWSTASGTSTGTTYDPPVLTATTHYRRGVSCVAMVYTTPVVITVNVQTVGGAVGSNSENYGISSGSLNLTGHTGSIQKWQTKVGSGNWTDVAVTTANYTYTNVTNTTNYRAEIKSGACPLAYSTFATVTIFAIPQVTISGNTALPPGGSVVFTATEGMYWYQWLKDNADISGDTASTLTITHPGTYKVKVKGSPTSSVYTTGDAVITYAFESQLEDMNYVQTVMFQTEGVTAATDLYDLTAKDFALSTSYFDGLGRPVQTVGLGAGGQGQDLISVNVYDEFGREALKFLPYAGAQRDGRYQPSAFAQQESFYNTAVSVPHDTVPYSQTLFEPSPLSRPLKDYGPGQAWSANENDKFVQHKYLVNVHGDSLGQEQVIAWDIDSIGNPVRRMSLNSGYYPSGSLMIKGTVDEQGNEVREYTNKYGQVLLKKVYAAGVITNLAAPGNWAQTYYIFDDLNLLRFVFQPELSDTLATSTTHNPDSTELANFAFQYRYDGRNRMTFKRVPGAAAVHMVYDKRDRLVLTQDGNLRTQNQWTFTKYDTLNRPVMTGIYEHATVVAPETMESLISTSKFREVVNSSEYGYTTAVFPTSNLNVLTVTYYDSYEYIKDNWGAGYQYVNDTLAAQGYTFPADSSSHVVGLVTGTKVKILDDGNTYLKSVSYYDDHQRPVQAIADNHKNGKDRISTLYDFSGKVLKTATTHVIGSTTLTVRIRQEYDEVGRLLRSYHKTNSAPEVRMVTSVYNSIGQAIAKNLHALPASAPSDYAQEIDYKYNIRGWLTSINQPNVNSIASGNTVVDFFGMELGYQDQLSGLGASSAFNGNISAMKWATLGTTPQAYQFSYDPMNRLLHATHFDKDSLNVLWAKHNGRFSERGLGYDMNGNIKALKRMSATGGYMDNLVYGYAGNQLLHVGDTGDDVAGFADGNPGTDDYLFDPNGNMSQDKNKGIGPGNIRYNFLNLPRSVRKSGSDSLVYVYDATGRKLQQKLYGDTAKVTDYINEFIYEDDALKFFNHGEGRVLITPAGPEYQYHLKDHLGNVRLTFTANHDIDEATATLEDANQTAEVGQFLRYTNARRIYSQLLDKTNGASPGYAQRLSGSANEKFGIARSLSVMPGDTIRAEVWGKYIDAVTSNWTGALNTLMGQIVAGTSGVVFEGGAYSTSTSDFSYAAVQNTGGSTGGPKAYLNWLIFDTEGNFIDGGYDRMSTSAKEYGQNVAHEQLSSPDIIITQPGIVYIYLSNEEETPVEVFFDDMRVELDGAVVQMDDYYPFGLTFNSYEREESTLNRWKFQGQEHVDDLGLNWDSFKWRNHQPDIGRFFNVDPLSEKYPFYSPYAFSGNEVTSAIELEGLEPLKLFSSQRAAAEDFGRHFNDNSIRDNREYGTKIYSMPTSSGVTGYSYAIPVVGSPAGLSGANMASLVVPSGGTVTAFDHTHAASTASSPTPYADNVFSGTPGTTTGGGDIGFAEANGIDGYVATPNGSLQEYNVTTNAISPLSTAMPKDSGPGTGAPGAGVSAPSTSTYSIQKGDNLTSIAKRYMTTVSAVQTENGISDPNKIKAGGTLKITN